MTRKKLTIIIFGLLGIFGFYKLGNLFAPGSYPFAETYQLDYSEEEVKSAIVKLKTDHPELIVPKVTIKKAGSWDLEDHQTENPNYWFVIYFYIQKRNKIYMTWTRPADTGETTFAFVSVNEGLDIGNWKEINDDFGFFENRKLKKEFEGEILKPIKIILGE